MEYNDFDYYVGWDSYWEHARKSVKNCGRFTADEVSAAGITLEEGCRAGGNAFHKNAKPAFGAVCYLCCIGGTVL